MGAFREEKKDNYADAVAMRFLATFGRSAQQNWLHRTGRAINPSGIFGKCVPFGWAQEHHVRLYKALLRRWRLDEGMMLEAGGMSGALARLRTSSFAFTMHAGMVSNDPC